MNKSSGVLLRAPAPLIFPGEIAFVFLRHLDFYPLWRSAAFSNRYAEAFSCESVQGFRAPVSLKRAFLGPSLPKGRKTPRHTP